MGRTKSNLIELFIDKAVLAVAAIIALSILLVFVIGSPNAVEYAGKKVSPGKINESIYNAASKLQEKLKQGPQDTNSYRPKTSLYLSMIENSIKDVNTNINFPLPGYSAGPAGASDRKYQLPIIEQIGKLSAAVITMAAFVPTEELSDTLTYENAETKLADIDFVTVESGINTKQLYESFKTAFAGRNVRSDWREEQYAKVVFAKVDLQRRTLQEDGSWSQWEEVPRTKICPFKKTLQLPAQTNDNDYVQIAMEQFAKPEIRKEILQPPVYDNAIPAPKWLCPSLCNERQKRLDKEQAELKKQQLEAEKAKKLQEKAVPKRTPAGRQTPTPPGGGPTPSAEGGEGKGTPPTDTTPRPQTRQSTRPTPVQPRQLPPRTKPTTTTPAGPEKPQALTEEQQFNEILFSDKTKLGDLEKLVFWANDDTAKPGEKYQYRIRIGVFNPIAGKPWFSEEQKDLQDQTALFSSFSEPTEPIVIPNKLHFFATDIKETDKTVEVEVARYTLGNWVSKKFSIKAGEEIGTVIDAAGTRLEKAGINIDSIDMATGYVMVDARRAASLTATGKVGEFYELLYCKPGQAIMTMPIKERFWSDEITKVYKEIQVAQAAEPVVLLPRNQTMGGTRGPETRPRPVTPTPESGTPGEFRGQPY
jgi:hypothetical protein